jgi:hypothetical protein
MGGCVFRDGLSWKHRGEGGWLLVAEVATVKRRLTAALQRGGEMKFAKVVFWVAGIWGLVVITPLYFMFNLIGKKDPPAITHPGFYYGFVGVALAWQVAFIFIAREPMRLRPMMIPSVIEKFSWGIAVTVLVAQGRMHPSDLVFAGTDALLGVLFVVAYLRTREGKN